MSSEADSVLLVSNREDWVVASLNRPSQRNAISQVLVDALHELCNDLERAPRTLIIRGEGGHFASGADVRELMTRTGDDARKGINTRVFDRIARLPMPVIAVIEGYALGGGAELAYAADIRIGTQSMKIGNPEPALGIIAGAGATWRLPALVGLSRAAEMLLTAKVLDSQEALDIGLVSSLVGDGKDGLAEAERMARRIGALDPAAVQASKRALFAPPGEHPQVDLNEQATLFESAEKKRRMTEFLEKRRPQ